MMLPVNLNENFINEESISVALMFPSQSLGIYGSEFVAAEANGLIADSHAPLGQYVLDVTMTQIETMVKPHGILDYFRWESVAPVHF